MIPKILSIICKTKFNLPAKDRDVIESHVDKIKVYVKTEPTKSTALK